MREKIELLHRICHWRLELDDIGDSLRVCASVCVVCVCEHSCVRACVRACMCTYVCMAKLLYGTLLVLNVCESREYKIMRMCICIYVAPSVYVRTYVRVYNVLCMVVHVFTEL